MSTLSSPMVQKCGCTDMAVVKHLVIEKGGTTYTCNVYDKRAEAGSNYMYYKVNGVEYYIPLCAVGEYRATPGRVKEHTGTQLAIATTGVPVYGKKEYRSPGTFTFVVPPGVTKLRVEVAGGGGGGGGKEDYSAGKGGNGGSGAKTNTTFDVTVGASIAVVVGAGGSSAYRKHNGGTGGTSKAGSVSARGGDGGTYGHYHGEDSVDGTNGTSYGSGGAGGLGAPTKESDLTSHAGSNGWVIIEYGHGVQ